MLFEKAILNFYKKNLLVRHDPSESVFYFTKEDFDGLMSSEFSFAGNRGQQLTGAFYYYGDMRHDRLIIFDHGMGNGHVAYMKEIELLCSAGYTVFSYDHTGTRMSEGENICGFAQSLCDLDFAINAIRSIPEYKDTAISVIGHSWGGFSTLNIGACHPEITHLVAMAGFCSVKTMLGQLFGGFMRRYIPAIYALEAENVPTYTDFDAVESLKKTDAKLMVIHSEDDRTVSFKAHFERMKNALADRENTEFVALLGKGHNPNYTNDAVIYKDAFFKDYSKKQKKKALAT
ncbi:MAG: alpha/beta hydrolase, partial [Clostridia bacterium]|nr:alpha/beta hydrolase [Clostridia bacterium]